MVVGPHEVPIREGRARKLEIQQAFSSKASSANTAMHLIMVT